jgi:hypothetical protein
VYFYLTKYETRIENRRIPWALKNPIIKIGYFVRLKGLFYYNGGRDEGN